MVGYIARSLMSGELCEGSALGSHSGATAMLTFFAHTRRTFPRLYES